MVYGCHNFERLFCFAAEKKLAKPFLAARDVRVAVYQTEIPLRYLIKSCLHMICGKQWLSTLHRVQGSCYIYIYIYHDNHISTIRKGITTNNEGDNRILLDRLLPSISHDNLEAKQGPMICHDFLLIGFHSSTTPLNHNLIKLRL
jgi:hypothetical protein